MKEAIVEQANYTYSSNGVMLSDEKIEIFNNLYKDNSFVSDGDNVVFVYSYAELSGGTRTGAYYCEVDMTALEDIIISPDSSFYPRKMGIVLRERLLCGTGNGRLTNSFIIWVFYGRLEWIF